ncbi:MAG: thiamine diphosphokinase, partial [Oscillospiraceae bacterium]
MNRCVILAARPVSVQMREYFRDDDYIIAVDAGYENARKLCVTPDICIGDFDSMDEPTGNIETIRLPKEKNETDTYAAAQIAVKKGCKEVFILGGLGGRLDHSIANMQTLVYLEKNGIRATLANETNEITVLLSG